MNRGDFLPSTGCLRECPGHSWTVDPGGMIRPVIILIVSPTSVIRVMGITRRLVPEQ